MKSPSIQERAARNIARISGAVSGQGGHDRTFHVAAVLVHGFALSESDALILLREWNNSCVPPWSGAELVHKIKSAVNAVHGEARGYLLNGKGDSGESPKSAGDSPALSKPVKAEFKPETLKRVAAKTAEIKDVVRFISEPSQVRVETQDSASVLRRLYQRGSGEKVILFKDMESQGQFLWEADRSDVTQDRHLPTGKDDVWFLPQPVDGKFHPNPRLGGKLSRRSEESVTAWPTCGGNPPRPRPMSRPALPT